MIRAIDTSPGIKTRSSFSTAKRDWPRSAMRSTLFDPPSAPAPVGRARPGSSASRRSPKSSWNRFLKESASRVDCCRNGEDGQDEDSRDSTDRSRGADFVEGHSRRNHRPRLADLAPRGPTVMRQRWASLLFLHWVVPLDLLRSLVPPELEIDTFEGRAYVGLVPFTMTGVRPTLLPAIRRCSDFHEVNVRTYVHFRGRDPGVWFFSLDAADPFAVAFAVGPTSCRIFMRGYLSIPTTASFKSD